MNLLENKRIAMGRPSKYDGHSSTFSERLSLVTERSVIFTGTGFAHNLVVPFQTETLGFFWSPGESWGNEGAIRK
jgi:hypothetical protein